MYKIKLVNHRLERDTRLTHQYARQSCQLQGPLRRLSSLPLPAAVTLPLTLTRTLTERVTQQYFHLTHIPPAVL